MAVCLPAASYRTVVLVTPSGCRTWVRSPAASKVFLVVAYTGYVGALAPVNRCS
jgi:hypothetical protein